jgi:hypothetical protein
LSGLAGIFKAPRNLEQIGDVSKIANCQGEVKLYSLKNLALI